MYLVILVERDGKTVGDVKHASFFEAAEKNADDSFHVSHFARSVEMIHDAEQHQRMDHHLGVQTRITERTLTL